MIASGARIVLGTDTGLHPGHTFGTGDHHELARWVQLGLSPAEAIVAATSRPAELLGIADMGTLAAGKSADFVVLDANPLDDIHNTRKIARVYLRGRMLDRDALLAKWQGKGADRVTAAHGAGGDARDCHELKLLPQNVHWGYYDPSVKPVLHIASGDTVRVETMIARGLPRLRAAGVKEDEIPESLKVVERTITERGPGAHPMTGPIFVDGAEPGDVLEVKLVGFEFLHPYGVSGFIPGSGTLPDEFPYVKLSPRALRRARGHGVVRARRDAEARAVLRIDRRRAEPAGRAHLERAARTARRQSRQQGAGRRIDALHPGRRARRADLVRRRPRDAGRRGSDAHRARDVAARHGADHGPQGDVAEVAARRRRRRTTSRWGCTPISTKRRSWR